MEASVTKPALNRRELMLRDGVTFLTLTVVAAALFGVTLLLFRSFEDHRLDLSNTWAARGQAALAQHRPADAVNAYRVALSYTPENRDYQLKLAQALAEEGRTEEATNYFLTLWDTEPGDGFINLMLARLSARAGHPQQAINYYQASIFGNWPGNGVEIRRDVRLELVGILLQQHEPDAARLQLLTAASNAPPTDKLNLQFGERFEQMGDLPDALTYYRKAVTDAPGQRAPLAKAGNTAYQLGEYAEAHRLLTRAAQAKSQNRDSAETSNLTLMAARSERLLELQVSPQSSLEERYRHLQVDSHIAQQRLAACMSQAGAGSTAAQPSLAVAPLAALATQWQSATDPASRNLLQQDAGVQNARMQLVFETEQTAARVCGPPEGDDALLLTLASQWHLPAAQDEGGREGAR